MPYLLLDILTTRKGSELTDKLPIRRGTPASPYKMKVLLSVPVTLEAGDKIEAQAVAQCTLPPGIEYQVMVSEFLVLAASRDAVDGVPLSPSVPGPNADKFDHHEQMSSWGDSAEQGLVLPTGRRFVNFVGYAAASSARPGDKLVVNKGYGKLTVRHWRPAV